MENNNILSDSQGGFRRNKSTYNKIWTLLNCIDYSKTEGKVIHMAYLDLAKAYDSVEYWRIIDTLQKMSFSNNFTELINSICIGNSASIITAYGNSDPVYFHKGIPQGSLISPILFDLF